MNRDAPLLAMWWNDKMRIFWLINLLQFWSDIVVMRIGISTRGLKQGSYAISSIVYHLTQSIINLASKKHDFFLYFNQTDLEARFPSSAHKRSIRLGNRFIYERHNAFIPLMPWRGNPSWFGIFQPWNPTLSIYGNSIYEEYDPQSQPESPTCIHRFRIYKVRRHPHLRDWSKQN